MKYENNLSTSNTFAQCTYTASHLFKQPTKLKWQPPTYLPIHYDRHIQTYLVRNKANTIKKNLWFRGILQTFIFFNIFSFCRNKEKVNNLSFKTTLIANLAPKFDQKHLAVISIPVLYFIGSWINYTKIVHGMLMTTFLSGFHLHLLGFPFVYQFYIYSGHLKIRGGKGGSAGNIQSFEMSFLLQIEQLDWNVNKLENERKNMEMKPPLEIKCHNFHCKF